MKKSIIILTAVLSVLFCASCQKTAVNGSKGEGYLSFSSFELDIDETVDRKATAANGNYTITVLDMDGNEVVRKSYSEIKNNDDKLALSAGTYTLNASSSDQNVPYAEFEQPIYGVSKTFSIEAGKVTEVGELTCTLLQCKVTVAYSEEFLAAVTGECSTKVTVTSGYPLEYALHANKIYDQAAGYFAVNGNSMEVVFSGNIDGKSQKMTKVFTGIAPKQWRQIKFVQKKNEQGDATFDIVIQNLINDEVLNNNIDASEDVLEEDPSAPKGDGGITLVPNYTESESSKNVFTVEYQTDDNGDYILDEFGQKKVKALSIVIKAPADLSNVDEMGMIIPDMLIKLKATVPGGVKKFEVDIETDNPSFASAVVVADATHLNLISPSSTNMIIFSVVPFPYGSELLGKTSVEFDLSRAQSAIYTYGGTHCFSMTIVDNANCKNVIPVTMIVE